MTRTITACLTATLMVAAGPALACKGGKVLFSDEFQQVDSSWGFDSPDVSVEEGKVKIKPQPDISNLLIYKAILFKDADYCVTVRMPNLMTDTDNTMAGQLFWATDYDNYYMFMITPSGYAEITRKLGGKWMNVVEWKQDPNIKQGAGAKNVLEIETRGDTITAYINDQKFASVKGQMPEGGGQIGMRAQSEKGQVDTWKFTTLKVTDLPTPEMRAAAAAPAAGAAPADPAPAGGVTAPAAPTGAAAGASSASPMVATPPQAPAAVTPTAPANPTTPSQ